MSDAMRLDRDGAELLPGALAPMLPALEDALAGPRSDRPGVRLRGIAALRDLLVGTGAVGRLVDRHLSGVMPVRALLLDKSATVNWSLGWHQDRTIVVAQRRSAPGFGPWTVKDGMLHVAPPIAILERMLTVRLHLDPVPETNAPLLVAPGSHRLGRVAEVDIDTVVSRCGTRTCLAGRGDVWVYSTPILHASAAATVPERRRVLQVDYAADPLPDGLCWAGL